MRAFSKPRLLVVTTSYPLDRKSASAFHVKAYLQGLAGDFKITIITPDTDRAGGEGFSGPEPGRVVRFRYAPRKWQVLANRPGGVPAADSSRQPMLLLAPLLWGAMLLTLVRHARKADLIHANWSLNGLVAGLAGLLFGLPVVTTLRGSDVRWAARSSLGKLILVACARYNRCLVTVSPWLKKQVADLIGCRKASLLTWIENGVDPDLLSVPAMDAGEMGNGLRFLVIANLVASKKADLAIKAFAGLAGCGKSVLEIIGEGPELEKLKALARDLGVAKRVVFHGGLHHGLVKTRLKACHVLVHPSLAEGRSNVVLEAMACAKAVVASRIAGIQEMVKDGINGLLFAPGSVLQLRSRLRQLANDPGLCARLGQAARAEVLRRNLGWQHTASRYSRLLLACVRDRRRA